MTTRTGGGAAVWCLWCHRASGVLAWLVVPGQRAVHTAWMPRSCRSSCMVGATMLFGPVPTWRSGQEPVSAAPWPLARHCRRGPLTRGGALARHYGQS